MHHGSSSVFTIPLDRLGNHQSLLNSWLYSQKTSCTERQHSKIETSLQRIWGNNEWCVTFDCEKPCEAGSADRWFMWREVLLQLNTDNVAKFCFMLTCYLWGAGVCQEIRGVRVALWLCSHSPRLGSTSVFANRCESWLAVQLTEVDWMLYEWGSTTIKYHDIYDIMTLINDTDIFISLKIHRKLYIYMYINILYYISIIIYRDFFWHQVKNITVIISWRKLNNSVKNIR